MGAGNFVIGSTIAISSMDGKSTLRLGERTPAVLAGQAYSLVCLTESASTVMLDARDVFPADGELPHGPGPLTDHVRFIAGDINGDARYSSECIFMCHIRCS